MVTWGFLILLGFGCFIVMLVAVPVGLVSLATSPDVRKVTRRAGAAILPLAVIGAGLLAVLGTTSVKLQSVATPATPEPPQRAIAETVPSDDPGARLASIVVFPPHAESGQQVDALPDWMTSSSAQQAEPGTQRFVYTSLRFSSVEEAERDLLAWVQPKLAAYLQSLQIPLDGPATLDEVRRSGAILSRVHLQFLVDLGSSSRPVYRATWQIALTPAVSEFFAAEHRRVVSGDAAKSTEPQAPVLADPTQPIAITSFDTNSDVARIVDTLPAWVSAWKDLPGSPLAEQFVLTSRRYSSVEEAEQELLAALRPRLDAYLRRHATSVDPAIITLADVRRTEAILGRVHEQFLVDLGSSQQPVYRVTWQVWLRPSVRDAFAADDRLAERDERLWQLGLGAGLLTLLFGAWAAYFRIDDQTQGRYRGRLKLAAIATTLAGAAVTLLG